MPRLCEFAIYFGRSGCARYFLAGTGRLLVGQTYRFTGKKRGTHQSHGKRPESRWKSTGSGRTVRPRHAHGVSRDVENGPHSAGVAGPDQRNSSGYGRVRPIAVGGNWLEDGILRKARGTRVAVGCDCAVRSRVDCRRLREWVATVQQSELSTSLLR